MIFRLSSCFPLDLSRSISHTVILETTSAHALRKPSTYVLGVGKPDLHA